MHYIKPKSLTWWSGVFAMATGGALLFMPDHFALSEFGRFLVMFAGGNDASPAALMFLGSGLIGIRDKLERSMGK